jgi:heparinase II/III-like protein
MPIVSRLARMDRAELTWRGAAAARIAVDRVRARISRPRWNRRDLHTALAPLPALSAARTALANARWDDAQRQLAAHFATTPQRFVIGATMRHALADRIRRDFPGSAPDAIVRADRILAGEYDVLGFRGLRFDRGAESTQRTPREEQNGAAAVDWQYDPIHDRRPPGSFWSTVRYLDRSCGDHKIIWELNRHQHWLTLGRAYWLTGDSKYRARMVAELESWMQGNPPLTGINWASMLELGFRSLSWIWALQFFVNGEGPAKAGHHVRQEIRASPTDRQEIHASATDPQEMHASSTGVVSGFSRTGETDSPESVVPGFSGTADDADAGTPWVVDLLLGIDRQLAHVEHNLSYYFSPNTHLLGEALALYVAGRALPELAASERRAAIGRRVLVAEIDRQIAADGGHCERSAYYHRYTLDFYLLALAVARITADPAAADFERAAGRLAAAARLLADDNARLPHIGDDDGGALVPMFGRESDDVRGSLAIAAALLNRPDLQVGDAPEDVIWMLGERRALQPGHSKLPIASNALPETGYYVSRTADGDHLVIDAGPHGYQNGGHAHADALSLTFTSRGIPLLIDPGTVSYTTDPELRDRMRSSAMHNTLTIDGRSQSIPKGPFHWTHAADGRLNRWTVDRGCDYFDGAHNGYAPIEHRRRVLARHGDLLVVADFVSGAGRHSAAAHWHVDPRWTVDVRDRRVELTTGDRRITLVVADGGVEAFTGDETTGLGWCSPVYGRLDQTTTVRVTRQGDGPFRLASVFGLDSANPVASVEWVSDTTLRITRERSVDEVVFTETDPSVRRTPNDERPMSNERSSIPERSAKTPERETKDPLCAASLAS